MSKSPFARFVGYVGLGDMGAGIASHLIESGINVVVFDLKRDAVQEIVAKGAKAASSLADLVHAVDVILICVDPEAAVIKVTSEVVSLLRSGQTVIIQSTVRPQIVIDAAIKALERGGNLFDAPVSGTYEDRRNGSLAVLVGARAEEMGDLLTLLETVGNPVFLDTLGGGVAAKLANNAMSSVTRAGLMEIIRLADAYGISEANLLKVLRASSGNSFVAQNWLFFDDLARAGIIMSKQPQQGEEIMSMARDADVFLPLFESHLAVIKDLDQRRYNKLNGLPD